MKLSEWLANSGTSQSELARRLGVTQGRVSQLVAGALPSLDLANKIAAATGTPMTAALYQAAELDTASFSVVHIRSTNPRSRIIAVETHDALI